MRTHVTPKPPVRRGRRVRGNPFRMDVGDVARNRILFHLLTEASGKGWKYPFELKFRLANPAPEFKEAAIPKEAVREITRELLRAINFFHAGAIAFDVDTMTAKEVKGEPAAYAAFDGYTLTIGSAGYAG